MIRLFTVGSVTVSTVMGGFLAYALIGFASAYLFIGIDALTTQDFFAQGPAEPDDFIYFSMVTLSTVGFGDLTAATDLGRRLVVIEALTGQVFIVVLISRLISLWGAPSTSDPQE